MQIRTRLKAGLLGFALLALPGALLANSGDSEIAHLLQVLEQSSCDFYRNGSWHSAERARAHLQRKYEHVSKRKSDLSTEEFIQLAASKSSRSGKAYRVRCGDAETPSSDWFLSELERLRSQPSHTP